jgi:hypothetical protein
MATYKILFTAFALTFLAHSMTAQTVGLSLDKLKTVGKPIGTPPQYSTVFLPKKVLRSIDNQAISDKKPLAVPCVFSVEALPFFCKIEYKMGLNQKLPVKFRLGDVQYVEQLEGKH